MKIINHTAASLVTALVMLLISVPAARAARVPAIIPAPASMEVKEGNFPLKRLSTYALPQCERDSVARLLDLFTPQWKRVCGTEPIEAPADARAGVSMVCDSDMPREAYGVTITPEAIRLTASSPAGFFHALTTLSQIITTADDAGTIPALVIADSPRFGWRGFMLDEGRHFFGPDEVKRVIDAMALYKMNRLHWHLTEDQGWRLALERYPRLTEVGATRTSNALTWKGSPTDNLGHEGYYTPDQIRDIVAYARDRFIEIVPEIDIPGHTQAAIAAYPEILACDPEADHQVWLSQGVSTDVINVGSEQAVAMVCDIIDEVSELFPYGYIHLGGDECPTDKWQQNADCRRRLAEIGSTDYRDLQLDFYGHIARHIGRRDPAQQKKMIFWNEVLHGNTSLIPTDFVVMAWVGAEEAAREAVKRGIPVILTPQPEYYINRRQSPAPTEPLTQGQGTETLRRVYDYRPADGVDPDSLDRYLGVQANLWTEYISSPATLEYVMLPRLVAVAEAGWTPQQQRSYDDFTGRLRRHTPLFDAHGWNYARHFLAEPGANNQ